MPAVREFIARILAPIAGNPVQAQFGWNSATGRPAFASVAGAYRDVAMEDVVIQTAAGGVTNVALTTGLVIVSHGAAAATIRLPVPNAHRGRCITVKRANSTQTGTLTIGCQAAGALVETTTGTFATSTNFAAAMRFSTYVSDGALWHRIR